MKRIDLGNILRPGFLVDYHSYDQGVGGQISWADTPDAYKDANGHKALPAGKVVVVLNAGPNAGKLAPHDSPAAAGATEFCLLVSSANEHDRNDSLSGYGTVVSGVIYENLLPDATGNPRGLPAALKNGLAASGKFVWQRRAETRG